MWVWLVKCVGKVCGCSGRVGVKWVGKVCTVKPLFQAAP